MAAFDTTRPAVVQSSGRFVRIVADLFGAFADWNDSRLTRNALAGLTNRELDDIGLSRSDIAKF